MHFRDRDGQRGLLCLSVWMPQRSETWPGGGVREEDGSFEVPSEGSDLGGDGVAMAQSPSRTWCSSMDDGRK